MTINYLFGKKNLRCLKNVSILDDEVPRYPDPESLANRMTVLVRIAAK